jgi:hypothetical protein
MLSRLALLFSGALAVTACSDGGTSGSAGSAGTAGSAGKAGSGGSAGTAGAAGTAMSGGSAGAPACPPRSSPSCCPGDGECCDCVSGNTCPKDPFIKPDDAVMKFDECACQPQVCGATCNLACMGMGIDSGCQDCVTEAAKNACSIEFANCPIHQP